MEKLSENSTDELLDIIAKVTASMLRHLDVPENEVTKFTEQVKENKMAELFDNFVNDVDMSSLYKIALERVKWRAMKAGEEQGLAEAVAQGLEKGLVEGEAKGEAHFAELTRLLLEAGRLDDLAKAASDAEYRNKLYKEAGI